MPRRDPQAKREADNAYDIAKSRRTRDIADGYPPPGDLARRAACELDLRLFCETYFPAAFPLAWSPDHLTLIARMEQVIIEGGLFAIAAPRGSGKTTIAVRACLWALLYGHRRFVCLIAATERRASDLLKKHLKVELVFNEALTADFRQVCYPLQRLENNGRRIAGQLFDGQQTLIEWSSDRLTLPTMPDSACDGVNVGGSTVSVVGLTGALRGQTHTLPSGEILRPGMVILDDPSTRESAQSPSQSAERLALIQGDVLGMAGPDTKIAAIMPCTVIRSGDTADILLDRERNPQWQGEKFKLLTSLPTDTALWEEYARIRAEELKAGRGIAAATEFYVQRQEAMDAGAFAPWAERFNDDEASAIQHAMNLKLANEATFYAEYQNSPIRPEESDTILMTADQIAAKLNGVPRGLVPTGAEHLTAFIDVHDSILYFGVVAWSAEFTGSVVAYGAWPDQHRRYFAARKLAQTLPSLYPGTGREGAIRSGLMALTDRLLSQDWQREDGILLRIGRCLIDSGYVPDVVRDVCQHSPHAAVLMPSRGQGVGAASKPISEYDKSRCDRLGWYWFVPKPTTPRAIRDIRFDANFFKSFVHARLAVAMGDVGALSLYGHDPEEHRLIADHLLAETPIRVSGQGRTLDEWRHRPDRPDNHYLDVLVGNAAAASFMGAILPGTGVVAEAPKQKRTYVTYAEIQARKAAQSGQPVRSQEFNDTLRRRRERGHF